MDNVQPRGKENPNEVKMSKVTKKIAFSGDVLKAEPSADPGESESVGVGVVPPRIHWQALAT